MHDHVTARKRSLDNLLDAIGDRVALTDGGSRGDSDDNVDERAPGGLS